MKNLNKTLYATFGLNLEIFHLTDQKTSLQPKPLNFDICIKFMSVMDSLAVKGNMNILHHIIVILLMGVGPCE